MPMELPGSRSLHSENMETLVVYAESLGANPQMKTARRPVEPASRTEIT